jgi:hypothetical protein
MDQDKPPVKHSVADRHPQDVRPIGENARIGLQKTVRAQVSGKSCDTS